MGRKTFCKLTTTGNKRYYLLADIEEDGKEGIHLTLSDGESAWSRELTGDDLEDLSKKLKMKFSDFVSETVKALTRENVGNMNFLYEVKTWKDDEMELKWKKHMAMDDIKFQLGRVVLQPVSDASVFTRDVFSFCIDNMVDLKNKISSLETDNQRLSQERSQALKRLDKCVAAKEEIEKELYSKFVAVLNSKKEKIQELRKEIEEGSRSNGASVTDSPPKASTSKQTATGGGESPAHSLQDRSNEDTTDDEKTPPTKRRRGGASVRRIESDSSLVLDDGDDIESTAASRRPRRQASGGRKQTPSKPVLPRVRSGGRGEATDRRSSMRKSGSGASNKSAAEVVDADDLLDDL
ncbi:DNA repair protein XRCC4-like isoform X2 [Liolophura sinensis]|uniref:DNA repair protein XRCC4-like isoform X2 n=1 Tax=Liolophura sinensis TaxID=3198878 RepID=UPI0031581EDB